MPLRAASIRDIRKKKFSFKLKLLARRTSIKRYAWLRITHRWTLTDKNLSVNGSDIPNYPDYSCRGNACAYTLASSRKIIIRTPTCLNSLVNFVSSALDFSQKLIFATDICHVIRVWVCHLNMIIHNLKINIWFMYTTNDL